MKVITNTTSLTTEEIIAQVTEFQKFFSDFKVPAQQSFSVAEDGRLIQAGDIHTAPIVISNED